MTQAGAAPIAHIRPLFRGSSARAILPKSGQSPRIWKFNRSVQWFAANAENALRQFLFFTLPEKNKA
jgi:hypothetical protein